MIRTRELTSTDLDLWRTLRLEGARLYPEAFLLSSEESSAFPKDVDMRSLDLGGRFGAFDGEKPVGIAALNRQSISRCRHRGSVGPFYVRRSAQGGGAARALMNALIDFARANGVWQLELSVAADNPRAIRFYEGFGFAHFGVFPNAVLMPDGAQDDRFYVLDLRGEGNETQRRG
ncbi:MAG: N-acetyltransferase family protein [Ruegeria sp.]